MLTPAGPLLKRTSLYMWRKKLQPATLFVVLNIPPVCYEFPNLAMRAILEWTPGRAWRQSEDRELHLKNTSNPFEKRKNTHRIFFYNESLRPRIFWHKPLWRTNFYKHSRIPSLPFLYTLRVHQQKTSVLTKTRRDWLIHWDPFSWKQPLILHLIHLY